MPIFAFPGRVIKKRKLVRAIPCATRSQLPSMEGTVIFYWGNASKKACLLP